MQQMIDLEVDSYSPFTLSGISLIYDCNRVESLKLKNWVLLTRMYPHFDLLT